VTYAAMLLLGPPAVAPPGEADAWPGVAALSAGLTRCVHADGAALRRLFKALGTPVRVLDGT